MAQKIHPESKVELSPLIAKHYDLILNFITLGKYKRFITQAIRDMDIKKGDKILDLGCGTGKNAGLIANYLDNTGSIMGIDVSPIMGRQFSEKFNNNVRINFDQQRIDIPFQLNETFNKVFISFVIHGLPHEYRKNLILNAVNHLKPGGQLVILDFSEFDMDMMPALHRYIFKTVECRYAFDYIERDWKSILKEYGFSDFTEYFYMKNYTRLLSAKINGPS